MEIFLACLLFAFTGSAITWAFVQKAYDKKIQELSHRLAQSDAVADDLMKALSKAQRNDARDQTTGRYRGSLEPVCVEPGPYPPRR